MNNAKHLPIFAPRPETGKCFGPGLAWPAGQARPGQAQIQQARPGQASIQQARPGQALIFQVVNFYSIFMFKSQKFAHISINCSTRRPEIFFWSNYTFCNLIFDIFNDKFFQHFFLQARPGPKFFEQARPGPNPTGQAAALHLLQRFCKDAQRLFSNFSLVGLRLRLRHTVLLTYM